MLLERELLDRIERLALASRKRVAAAHPGDYRSRRLGSSVDFADWRQYVPGDDFRRVDYQILARLDRLLVRLYEAEEELVVRVVLDASASMEFGGKFSYAKKLAGALAYIAAVRRNRARVWAVSGARANPSPWARSRDAAMYLFQWIDEISPSGKVDLHSSLRSLSASGGLRGLTVLITDLLSENWEAVLRTLGGPHSEAALIQVLSKKEIEPEERGDLRLVDSESSTELDVSISDRVLREYRERTKGWMSAVASACRKREIRYVLADPDSSLDAFLTTNLRREGLVG